MGNTGFVRISITALLAVIFLLHGVYGAVCKETQSIPIKTIGNRTIIPVSTGSSGTLDVILDSGMAFDGLLIYNRDLIHILDSNKAFEVRVPGAGGGEPSSGMMVDSVSFFVGNIELKNQKIIVLQNDIYDGFPSDGILGYSILGHYAVELNYDSMYMFLHDPDELAIDDEWTAIPLYFKNNGIPWLQVSVSINDEQPVELSMYIDFASGDTVELLEKSDMKFSLPEKTEKAYLGTGLSGDIYGKKGRITKLIIGPHELDDVEAAFAPARVRSKQDNADGIIGSGCLSRFNVIFDYKNLRLLLKLKRGK